MNKPASELIALADERAVLMAKNAAATSWGAAVGARSERIKEIDRLLAANQSGERAGVDAPFQDRVRPWMLACFGPVIPFDKTERNHRFLEEAIELVQSLGCTQSEAHQLVDYVYGRPEGEPNQEVGGVMITLAALCLANNLNMADAGETELARIWTKVEQIRAKQAAKPKHSPLPESTPNTRALVAEARLAEAREVIQRLEWSCGQLAATRPHPVYAAMIAAGQAQALLELDNARRAARAFTNAAKEKT